MALLWILQGEVYFPNFGWQQWEVIFPTGELNLNSKTLNSCGRNVTKDRGLSEGISEFKREGIKGDRTFSREKVVDFQNCGIWVDWEKGNCQDIAHTYFGPDKWGKMETKDLHCHRYPGSTLPVGDWPWNLLPYGKGDQYWSLHSRWKDLFQLGMMISNSCSSSQVFRGT